MVSDIDIQELLLVGRLHDRAARYAGPTRCAVGERRRAGSARRDARRGVRVGLRVLHLHLLGVRVRLVAVVHHAVLVDPLVDRRGEAPASTPATLR